MSATATNGSTPKTAARARRARTNAAPETARSTGKIQLAPLEIATYAIPIQGETPLIPHKWGAKALRMMREAQSGPKVRARREPKVPEEEAEQSTYRLEDGRPGMPATAFKAAIADAARFFDGITMVQAKQSFFVEGEGVDQLVPIVGESYIREDTPRNATGVADLRYRRCFDPWSAVLHIRFITSAIDLQSVVHLVNAAGLGGVGDWRPSAPRSKSGTFGRFFIPDDAEIKQLS